MSDSSFYQVLGVGRSATADEIRSAYRELVKKYHPDLFPNAGEKAAATKKLKEINEAYAVLGNEARRQGYDEESLRKSGSRVRSPVAPERRSASAPRRGGNLRRKAAEVLTGRLYFSKKRAAYSLAAGISVLALIYVNRNEPKLTTAWILMEKLEISPTKSGAPLDSAIQPWVRLGQYADVSECAATLKKIVRADEQEGGRAVYDERRGTMAITVFVKNETIDGQGNSPFKTGAETPAAVDPASKNEREHPESAETTEGFTEKVATKRVRSLECRATQRLESESWLRRTLKSVGLP